ncbi:MAG: shikimate kinase [Acidobacteriota bacterium]
MPHIFLIGFMGAGKTTAGRLLAQRLGLPFIDSDQRIEAGEGSTVPAIFRERGEVAFRDLETSTLRGLSSEPDSVVALGGGTIESAANRKLLQELGSTVWLDIPLEEIRLRGLDGQSRPLFRDSEQVDELYRRRLPLYQSWGIHIQAAGLSPEEVVDAICQELNR